MVLLVLNNNEAKLVGSELRVPRVLLSEKVHQNYETAKIVASFPCHFLRSRKRFLFLKDTTWQVHDPQDLQQISDGSGVLRKSLAKLSQVTVRSMERLSGRPDLITSSEKCFNNWVRILGSRCYTSVPLSGSLGMIFLSYLLGNRTNYLIRMKNRLAKNQWSRGGANESPPEDSGSSGWRSRTSSSQLVEKKRVGRMAFLFIRSREEISFSGRRVALRCQKNQRRRKREGRRKNTLSW